MNCSTRALPPLEGLLEGLKDADLSGNPWFELHPEQKEVTDLPGQRNSTKISLVLVTDTTF